MWFNKTNGWPDNLDDQRQTFQSIIMNTSIDKTEELCSLWLPSHDNIIV
jgi:hypothetical protein